MIRKVFLIIFTLAIFIICWQTIEDKINVERKEVNQTSLEAFIPTPVTIYETFKKDGGLIITEIFHTLRKAGIGFMIGVSFAVIVAISFLFLPFFRDLIFPIAFAINSFPIVGLAPAIILAFGQGSMFSIIFISSLICYFPTLISMDTAFRETDKDLLELMHVLNASSLQKLIKVRLPLAMPYFFLSLKLAIPGSIIGATMGEWLGSRTGIGQLITIALYQLKPGLLYASLISIAVVSLLSIVIVIMLEHFLFPWKRIKN